MLAVIPGFFQSCRSKHRLSAAFRCQFQLNQRPAALRGGRVARQSSRAVHHDGTHLPATVPAQRSPEELRLRDGQERESQTETVLEWWVQKVKY